MSTILIFQCAELSSSIPASKANIYGVQQSQEVPEDVALFCWVGFVCVWFDLCAVFFQLHPKSFSREIKEMHIPEKLLPNSKGLKYRQ